MSRNKLIKLFAVLDLDKDEYISFTSNKKEAKEFITKHIIYLNKSHYDKWAELHKDENEYNYILDVVGIESILKYRVVKLYYDIKTFASILRINNRYTPIGCSFETDYEVEIYNKIDSALKNNL